MSDHPKFDEFKAERLKDPEVKAAYDEAVARRIPPPMSEFEELATLLAEHWQWEGTVQPQCQCGEPMPDIDASQITVAHRAHVAEVVAGSDWLAAVKAQALRTAQKAIAGEDTVEWARGATASHIAYAQAIGILDDLIDDIEDRAGRVDAEDGGRR